MNEYERKAKRFLKSNDAKMTITHVKDDYGGYAKGTITDGWLYQVRIDRNHHTWKFQFSDSVYNRDHCKRPTQYDVLACLVKYECGDILDFMSEYGYDIDIYDGKSINKVKSIYDAVCKEYANVLRIFGDCLEELREIN